MAEIESGKRLGKFLLLQKLGEGASGEVWLAEDEPMGRRVALKLLLRMSPADLERFDREGKLLARLNHPAIVPVYDMGVAEGRRFISMAYVPGGPPGREPLTPRRALELMAAIAEGVHHAHENGVLHRDIKPGNILLAEDGRAFLTDFGLAKSVTNTEFSLTRSGTVLGTPQYMSPEQARGRIHDLGPASDVYSLGATLYFLLCGRDPHEGGDLVDVLSRVAGRDPPSLRRINPNLAPDIQTIVAKAMEKEPRRRYESAAAFAADLRRFLNGEPIHARPASLVHRFYRRFRRRPMAHALAALAVLAILGAAVASGLGLRSSWRLEEERRLERQRLDAERDSALRMMRETARASLETALRLRRRGANESLEALLPTLQAAYREAVRRAPELAEVDYLMGRMHRSLLQDELALSFQEKALAKDPAFAPALYERAVLQSRIYGALFQKAKEALQILSDERVTAEAARKAPELTRDQVEESRPELRARREAVRRDCEKLAEGAVDPGDALAARGILVHHEGRHEDARRILLEAVGLDPLKEEAWQTLAQSCASLASAAPNSTEKEKYWSEAEQRYGAALELDRGYTPHRLGRAEIRTLRAFHRSGRGLDPLPDFAAAEEDLTAALGLQPDLAEARLRRGVARAGRAQYLVRYGRDPEADLAGAEEDYSESIRLDATQAQAWRRRGSLYVARAFYRSQRGRDPGPDYALAESDLAEAIRLDPSHPDPWSRRGMLRLNRASQLAGRGSDPLSEFESSEGDFSQAIRIRKDLAESWAGRANLRNTRGLYLASRGKDPLADYAGAEEDHTEAIRIDPEFASGWLQRGGVRSNRGIYKMSRSQDPTEDFAAAEEDFSQALKLNPDLVDGWIKRGIVRLNRGAHRFNSRQDPRADYESSEGDFAQALKLNPVNPEAWAKRGTVRWNRGLYLRSMGGDPSSMWVEADKDYSEAIRLNPKDAEVWMRRGNLRGTAGRQGAEEDLSEALNLNPRLADAWRQRGDLRFSRASQSQDPEAARRDYAAAHADYTEAIRNNAALERRIGSRLKQALERSRPPEYNP